jgi:hypothetical protein
VAAEPRPKEALLAPTPDERRNLPLLVLLWTTAPDEALVSKRPLRPLLSPRRVPERGSFVGLTLDIVELAD